MQPLCEFVRVVSLSFFNVGLNFHACCCLVLIIDYGLT